MSSSVESQESALEAALEAVTNQHGRSLLEIQNERPTLVALLRHTGCPFCVEALDDIRKHRAEIEREGVGIAVVFQAPEGQVSEKLFGKMGLADIDRCADPERTLYHALDVPEGNPWQLFGPHVLMRVFHVIVKGLRPHGKAVGSVKQLPGTVLLHKGEIVRRYVHRSQADRANYRSVACGV